MITCLSCATGSYILAVFYKIRGAYTKVLATLYKLLSVENISTGKLMFRIPFPWIKLDPIFLTT